ncbi:MAG: HEAT repeat domain-containing protein, partial [Planctomycetota bacterium]|nr:HEAT repeat domain-containing protein [Planctomycetota bacterium]
KAKEKSNYVKRLIRKALTKIPEPSIETSTGEIIATSLRSSNPMIRRHAAHLIGTLDAPSAVITPELVMTLNDKDDSVVEVAIHSLSRLCKKKKENWDIVGPEFEKILTGNDCNLATEVAIAWSKQAKSGPLGREKLEEEIIGLFHQPQQSRKEQLLKALQIVRPWGKKGLALNLKLVNSPEAKLRSIAFESLRSAPLQAATKVKLFAALEVPADLEPELQKLLSHIGNDVVPAMFQLLQSESKVFQKRAQSVLNQIRIYGKSTIQLLNHQHPKLRIWAATKVESLREMPIFPDATKILEVSLDDESPIVRASAARALGLTTTPIRMSTRRRLMKSLEDKDGLVRRRSAQSLGAIGKGDPGVLEALIAHKKDPSRVVRIAVNKAIAKLSR